MICYTIIAIPHFEKYLWESKEFSDRQATAELRSLDVAELGPWEVEQQRPATAKPGGAGSPPGPHQHSNKQKKDKQLKALAKREDEYMKDPDGKDARQRARQEHHLLEQSTHEMREQWLNKIGVYRIIW